MNSMDSVGKVISRRERSRTLQWTLQSHESHESHTCVHSCPRNPIGPAPKAKETVAKEREKARLKKAERQNAAKAGSKQAASVRRSWEEDGNGMFFQFKKELRLLTRIGIQRIEQLEWLDFEGGLL